MQRTDSFEKTLMLWKADGRRRRGRQRMRWLDGITDTMDMGLGGLWELVINKKAWHAVVHGIAKNQTQLGDWTELNWISYPVYVTQKVKGLVALLAPLFAIPWTVVHKAPLSMGFSRKEHWSGWPFPSPGDLPNPGMEHGSPVLQVDPLLSKSPEKPHITLQSGIFSSLYVKIISRPKQN